MFYKMNTKSRNKFEIIFLFKHEDVDLLNKALFYIINNEPDCIKVHFIKFYSNIQEIQVKSKDLEMKKFLLNEIYKNNFEIDIVNHYIKSYHAKFTQIKVSVLHTC